jgi:hypothetical protein
MQQLRLLGLILFITTVFLGMAAVATQTREIRLYDARNNNALDEGGESDEAAAPRFVSMPILWPLVACGGLGLIMWFGTAPRESAIQRRKRRSKRH